MGIIEGIRGIFSSGSNVSNSAEVWAFDFDAEGKQIHEYLLITVLTDEVADPIFLQVREPIHIPEETLAYHSKNDKWVLDVNGEPLPAHPCLIVPPSQTDEVDETREDVIEVPDELTGKDIPAYDGLNTGCVTTETDEEHAHLTEDEAKDRDAFLTDEEFNDLV